MLYITGFVKSNILYINVYFTRCTHVIVSLLFYKKWHLQIFENVYFFNGHHLIGVNFHFKYYTRGQTCTDSRSTALIRNHLLLRPLFHFFSLTDHLSQIWGQVADILQEKYNLLVKPLWNTLHWEFTISGWSDLVIGKVTQFKIAVFSLPPQISSTDL